MWRPRRSSELDNSQRLARFPGGRGVVAFAMRYPVLAHLLSPHNRQATLMRDDAAYMDVALRLAVEAGGQGEVPIGAVLVHEGDVIAASANRRERDQDPTGHAEILALRQAGHALGSWRLNDCTLYVTLEPCPMCMGAVINARLGRLVFACRDPKAGAAVSLYTLGNDDRLNHRLIVSEGVRRAESSQLLSSFFAALRTGNR